MASCQICNNLCDTDSAGKNWPWVTETADVRSLQLSGQNGCLTCSILYDGLAKTVPQLFENNPVLYYRIGSGAMHQERRRPFLTINIGLGLEEETQVEYFLARDDRCPWRVIGTAILPPENTRSEASFQLATEWLQDCVQEHKACNSVSAQPLPTRILDVGSSNDSQSEIRLYESQNEADQYICLSHCWGASRSIMTTKDTLEKHKTGIPLSDLPKTFQDAVSICRQFGVRYLWIDSLCIIQDSKEDWESEAAKMANFYQGAYLTIAASKSAGSHEGCFTASSVRNQTVRLAGTTDDGQPYSIHVRPVLPHWNHLRSHFTSFPLLTRGWVYQERLLSRRILHFGPRELIWECMEQTKCECFGTHERGFFTHPKLNYGEVVRAGRLVEDLAWRWRQMIMEYTSLRLTRVSDLLPALAGIAQDMTNFREGRYLAGVWEDSLVGDMCWSTWAYYAHNMAVTERTLADRTDPSAKDFRAPSWSWASRDMEIEYSDVYHFTSDANVVDLVAMPHRVGFVFGLDLGSVTLDAWLTTARIGHSTRPMPPHGERTRLFDIDSFGEDGRRKGPGCYFLPDYDLLLGPEEDRVSLAEPVYCARMGTTPSRVYSIVLTRTSMEDAAFRRVGLLTQTLNADGYTDVYSGLEERSIVTIY